MEDKKNTVDLADIAKNIKLHWKLFVITMTVSMAIAISFIFSIPRYYTCNVELAPELSSDESSGIGSLMSAVGLGGAGGSGTDAIYPVLYPNIMESNEFAMSLFGVPVTTKDGLLQTNYYDYLMEHQKISWWNKGIVAIRKAIVKPGKENSVSKSSLPQTVPPAFSITKKQENAINAIKAKVICNVDKKTELISLSVTDQDPLVCALIADTVMKRLQNFITDYRTKKANNDYVYTLKIYNQAKKEYELARQAYAGYSNSHWNLVSEADKSHKEDLGNQMNLKFNNLTAVSSQLQLAKAKVQERTPAFTIIKGPSIPLKPAGPKKMMLAIGVFIFVFFSTLFYIYRKRLIEIIL